MTNPLQDCLKIEQELTTLLNRYSLENGSDTPDFILAQYLLACLAAYNTAVSQREVWYGRGLKHVPTGGSGKAPTPPTEAP